MRLHHPGPGCRAPAVLLFGLLAAGCSSGSVRPDAGLDRSRPDGPREGGAPEAGPADHRLVSEAGDLQVPDQSPPGFLTVYFKKPADWADALIHYWKTWPDSQATTWPGTKMTAGSGGWYSFSLPQQQSAGIVFNDGTGKQTVDLWRERSGWFVPQTVVRGLLAGRWYDRDPQLYPRVSATPPGGNLYGEEIVTLEAEGEGVKASRYTLDGSDPKSGGTDFASGDKISVGGGLTPGQSLTLRLWAQGLSGEDQRTYSFQALASPAVEAWDGKTAPQSVNKSGRWVWLNAFPSPQGLQSRTVVLFLPADYDTSTSERYPVIYFHDGQNLVDSGQLDQEWLIDERYQELDAEGLIVPAIIVGIYNTSDREPEYAGCNDPTKQPAYAAWVVHTLKPYMDAQYRTKPQAEYTATLGSSYGGLISHYIAWNFSSVFGAALTLSTQFAFCSGPATLSDLQSYQGGKKPIRYWIDSGSDEGAPAAGGRSDYIERNRIFAESLGKNGWNEGTDLAFLEIPGGQHSQTWWQKRIKKVLYFMLRKEQPRMARIDLRTFLPSITVGGITYASVDLMYENNYWTTHVFADTTPPLSLVSSDPSVTTLDGTSGEVSGKAAGTVQLQAGFQSYNLSLPLTVQ